MTREYYGSPSHVGQLVSNNCSQVNTPVYLSNARLTVSETICTREKSVQLCTHFSTSYVISSALLIRRAQTLSRQSAQKMYGRSQEQSVPPRGSASRGWGNPLSEVSEQCCHYNGHCQSRFVCQLQLLQLRDLHISFERDKCPILKYEQTS